MTGKQRFFVFQPSGQEPWVQCFLDVGKPRDNCFLVTFPECGRKDLQKILLFHEESFSFRNTAFQAVL